MRFTLILLLSLMLMGCEENHPTPRPTPGQRVNLRKEAYFWCPRCLGVFTREELGVSFGATCIHPFPHYVGRFAERP